MDCSRLLPRVTEEYTGPRLAYYFLVLVASVSTIRSLIHILSFDGGAYSIARIEVAVEGGPNIIAMFAQWGASQLLLAMAYWLVIVRYRFLVPMALASVVAEQARRIVVGQLKPLQVIAPPPGAVGSLVLLPLSIVVFALSLSRGSGEPVTRSSDLTRPGH